MQAGSIDIDLLLTTHYEEELTLIPTTPTVQPDIQVYETNIHNEHEPTSRLTY